MVTTVADPTVRRKNEMLQNEIAMLHKRVVELEALVKTGAHLTAFSNQCAEEQQARAEKAEARAQRAEDLADERTNEREAARARVAELENPLRRAVPLAAFAQDSPSHETVAQDWHHDVHVTLAGGSADSVSAVHPPGARVRVDEHKGRVVRVQTDPGIDSDIKPPHGRHVRFDDGGEGLYHVDDLEPCSETAAPDDRALRRLAVAVAVLIAANDDSRGLDRPMPDLAWRDLKKAYSTWREAAASPTGSTE